MLLTRMGMSWETGLGRVRGKGSKDGLTESKIISTFQKYTVDLEIFLGFVFTK